MTRGWGLAIRAAGAISVAPNPTMRAVTSCVIWRARGDRFCGGGPGRAVETAVATAMAAAAAAARGGDDRRELALPRLYPPSHDHVRHAYSPRKGPLWSSVSAFLGWTESRARELVSFGGVYYKSGSAPATAKPKRELDPEREVEIGEYLRIFPEPRRYPACLGIDWESQIVYESAGLMLVNKPAGVPAHATVDNFNENMLAGLREVRPALDLFLPHRLDIDTSGLVIVAKNSTTLGSLNKLFEQPGLLLQTGRKSPRARRVNNKALRRAAMEARRVVEECTPASKEAAAGKVASESATAAVASAVETGITGAGIQVTKEGGAASTGAITKRYRALVQVLPGKSPLKASSIPLRHFQKVSPRAPKEFRRSRPRQPDSISSSSDSDNPEGGSWIECLLLVISADEAFALAGKGEGEGEGEGGVSRMMLQEVEVELLTGRTHQIRGQLAAEGCPIYGDFVYGPTPVKAATSMDLAAAPTPTTTATSGGERTTATAASGATITTTTTTTTTEPTGGSFALKRSPPTSVDVDVVAERQGVQQRGLERGLEGVWRRKTGGFVESPQLALQACHISLELGAERGETEIHSFSLGRETCWWVDEVSRSPPGLRRKD